ncbi:MAG TPA: hypothetical protein VGM88_10000 [Kofleriaceae bacterium]|jgi:hypothetical protein
MQTASDLNPHSDEAVFASLRTGMAELFPNRTREPRELEIEQVRRDLPFGYELGTRRSTDGVLVVDLVWHGHCRHLGYIVVWSHDEEATA